ncbi:MAG: GNAT family N-acetyltransferase [Ruminococcaceae bacterium]|nr:GNAT family N-acetyltransferase [Oscillospiraceae bacterium]
MINSGFEIRNASMNDVAQIREITMEAFRKYKELAKTDYPLAALNESDEDIINDIENNLVLVAYINGKVVGSVRVSVDGDTAYLSRFGVNPEYQNLGIGKALMNLVDINMKVRGVKKIQLHTGAKIKSLIIFYYGRGFYVESTNSDRGYIRALLTKDYN